MRRLLLVAFALSLVGCRGESPAPEPPARDPIAVEYVGAPELIVHSKPNDGSRIMTRFLNGESVSVLARKGDWAEVRISDGSGWAHAADLTGAAAAQAEQDNPTPKFRVAPAPVTQPGVHGTVYIEASVNNDGDVTATTLVTNTTGSDLLAARNAAALQLAKFYPMVRKGQKVAFLYDYRVDY